MQQREGEERMRGEGIGEEEGGAEKREEGEEGEERRGMEMREG